MVPRPHSLTSRKLGLLFFFVQFTILSNFSIYSLCSILSKFLSSFSTCPILSNLSIFFFSQFYPIFKFVPNFSIYSISCYFPTFSNSFTLKIKRISFYFFKVYFRMFLLRGYDPIEYFVGLLLLDHLIRSWFLMMTFCLPLLLFG